VAVSSISRRLSQTGLFVNPSLKICPFSVTVSCEQSYHPSQLKILLRESRVKIPNM
jgi:hypothetical protein